MVVIKDFFGNEHTVMPCSAEDVDVHFAKIRNVVPSEEVIQFKKRMSECINAGSAYTLSDGSCFFYYLNYKPCCAVGVAVCGKRYPLKMVALFVGIFKGFDLDTFKIDYKLHPGSSPADFKSIFTMISLKRRSTKGRPFVLRTDEMVTRLETIYKNRGISCVMS